MVLLFSYIKNKPTRNTFGKKGKRTGMDVFSVKAVFSEGWTVQHH